MKARKIALFGMMVALAFIFSYLESLVAINGLLPGMKLGLANIVVMTALYLFGEKEAFAISLIRILLVGFSFGNMSTLLYSLAGGILSCVVMILAKKWNLFSTVGVSVLGALFHNIGQILVAVWMLESNVLFHYLPILMITGTVTGVLIGILGGEMNKRLLRIAYI